MIPHPPGTLVVHTTSDLPIGLKRFSHARRRLNFLKTSYREPLHITFPPDGSQVELLDGKGKIKSLFLHAKGGVLPVRWWINGKPMVVSSRFGLYGKGRRNYWVPDGRGFAQLKAVDSSGSFSTSLVRIR